MNRKLSALLIALACGLSVQAQAQAQDHHHDHGGPQALQLNAGKKWDTDASLRQAMGNINKAMAEALPVIHKNNFKDADYQALADKLRKEVAYAVENCKLEPKADAMLHLVIADLSEAADTMEGKGKATRHDGAAKTLHALESYGKYFKHPGWHAAGSKPRH
jgi:hypothetical protein